MVRWDSTVWILLGNNGGYGKLWDELVHFLQGYGGTPPDGALPVFMFQELGIKTMDLELVLSQ